MAEQKNPREENNENEPKEWSFEAKEPDSYCAQIIAVVDKKSQEIAEFVHRSSELSLYEVIEESHSLLNELSEIAFIVLEREIELRDAKMPEVIVRIISDAKDIYVNFGNYIYTRDLRSYRAFIKSVFRDMSVLEGINHYLSSISENQFSLMDRSKDSITKKNEHPQFLWDQSHIDKTHFFLYEFNPNEKLQYDEEVLSLHADVDDMNLEHFVDINYVLKEVLGIERILEKDTNENDIPELAGTALMFYLNGQANSQSPLPKVSKKACDDFLSLLSQDSLRDDLQEMSEENPNLADYIFQESQYLNEEEHMLGYTYTFCSVGIYSILKTEAKKFGKDLPEISDEKMRSYFDMIKRDEDLDRFKNLVLFTNPYLLYAAKNLTMSIFNDPEDENADKHLNFGFFAATIIYSLLYEQAKTNKFKEQFED